MNCTLLVPVEGLMELFVYDIDPVEELRKRGQVALASAGLNVDDSLVTTLHFSITHPEQNVRATAITGLLTKSYVRVQGMAMFSGLSDGQATRIMMEVG